MSSPIQFVGPALIAAMAIGLIVVFIIALAKPSLLSGFTNSVSGFENKNGPAAGPDMMVPPTTTMPAPVTMPSMPAMPSMTPTQEGFADSGASDPSLGGPSSMPFAAGNAPSNCYPKNQLNPKELLPEDPNSTWAQVNPQGAGDIAGKNYLNAGALIGVNTVGQSLRNASYDLRSEPANPQVAVSPWFNSTIEPDTNRKTFEIA